jgi:hypothetical protein
MVICMFPSVSSCLCRLSRVASTFTRNFLGRRVVSSEELSAIKVGMLRYSTRHTMATASYGLLDRKSLTDLVGCDGALILSINSVSELRIGYSQIATHR